jgi:hypothetical protein
MDDTSSEVLEVLKCPVCKRYMMPPIPLCKNGHSLCSTCRQKVDKCPTCRQQFLKARSRLLDTIVKKIKYRCKYHEEGCQFISKSNSIKFHEFYCPHRPFSCPFSVVVTKDLCWSGQVRLMWDHIRNNHADLTLPGEEKFVFIVDCTGPGESHRAFYVHDETFFVIGRLINGDLCCCVLYAGLQERASRYNYKVTIKGRRGRDYATVCLPTESYLVNVETLFRNRGCAVFAHTLWNRCSEFSNAVSCEIEIQSWMIPPTTRT